MKGTRRKLPVSSPATVGAGRASTRLGCVRGNPEHRFWVFGPRTTLGTTIPAGGVGVRQGWRQRLGRSGDQWPGILGVAAQGLFGTPPRRGRVGHLCVASANCARWKSAANRLISSQASAITALLVEPPRNSGHVSPRAAGARHDGPRGGTTDSTAQAIPERAHQRGRDWPRAAAPPTPRGRCVRPGSRAGSSGPRRDEGGAKVGR